MEKYFKALGNNIRLKIVKTLNQNTLSVTQLTKIIGISQSSLSQHLSILREAKILSTNRSANQIFYKIKDDRASKFIIELKELEIK